MASAVIKDTRIVCFLTLPESQYLYLASLARQCGVSLDRYVSCAIQTFNGYDDALKILCLSGYEVIEVPDDLPIEPEHLEDEGTCDA